MKLFKVIETSFENFDNTVRSYLSKALGAVGYQYSYSQIFATIFEGIKGVMQNAMFYIEDALTEQNVKTAYRKTSIYSLAKISGYEPYYGSCATGLLNCDIALTNIADVKTPKVYIKNNSTVINNNTGIQYIVKLPTDFIVIDLSKPLTTTQFKIVQGTLKSAGYVATGEALETLHITTSSLYDRDYVEVFVDGEKWTQAASLYDMTEDSKEYVISVGYENEMDIMFGTGIYGKQLSPGQSIVVNYISHSGISGNISIDDDVDFVFNNSVYDSNGSVIKDVDFLNLYLASSISGGSESDSVENIRNMIGFNSRSLVLASEQNYRYFLSRFSFIGQSNIWCDNNSLEINIACLTNFKDTMHNTDDIFNAYDNKKLLLNNHQKQMVIDTINNSNKSFAGVTVKFIDPIIYKYSFIFYIKLKEDYDKISIKSLISDALANYFIYLPTNVSFIAKSDIIKYILEKVKYIESIDLTIISDIDELAYKNGYYYKYELVDSNGTQKYTKVKKIYDNSKTLGLDEYGNISVDGKIEIPIISNNVQYNTERKTSSRTTVKLPAVQCIFTK